MISVNHNMINVCCLANWIGTQNSLRQDLSEYDAIQDYHFDVIREDFLPDYLDMIESEVSKVRNSLRQQKRKVVAAIERLLTEITKSKPKPESYREFLEF